MADLAGMQLRLVYSLIKPVVRAAARFNVPIRSLGELVRLAYVELLGSAGESTAQIAEHIGQTPRNVRSLAARLSGDFFAAEKQVGLARQIEDVVAVLEPTEGQLPRKLPPWSPSAVRETLAALLAQGRVEQSPDGRLRVGKRYVVLSSAQFHHRIDALNHFLEGVYGALIERLVLDNRSTAIMKTISFSATPQELEAFAKRLEGTLRTDVAALEESATFAGRASERFTLTLSLAPAGTAASV